jgi:hypothetical protein
MNRLASRLVQGEPLLVPGGCADVVRRLNADLVYCVYNQGWTAAAAKSNVAPSTHGVTIRPGWFNTAAFIAKEYRCSAAGQKGIGSSHSAAVDLEMDTAVMVGTEGLEDGAFCFGLIGV